MEKNQKKDNRFDPNKPTLFIILLYFTLAGIHIPISYLMENYGKKLSFLHEANIMNFVNFPWLNIGIVALVSMIFCHRHKAGISKSTLYTVASSFHIAIILGCVFQLSATSLELISNEVVNHLNLWMSFVPFVMGSTILLILAIEVSIELLVIASSKFKKFATRTWSEFKRKPKLLSKILSTSKLIGKRLVQSVVFLLAVAQVMYLANLHDQIDFMKPVFEEKVQIRTTPEVLAQKTNTVSTVPKMELLEKVNPTIKPIVQSINKRITAGNLSSVWPAIMMDSRSSNWNFKDQQDWANNFPNCSDSRQQSPIDLDSRTNLQNIEIRLPNQKIKLSQTKFKKQIVFNPNQTVSFQINHQKVNLKQITLRSPSEHKRNGVTYPLELQFYLENSNGQLYGISQVMTVGEKNQEIQKMLTQMVQKKTSEKDYDLTQLITSKNNRNLIYEGTLPFPPCTRMVWVHMEQENSLSWQQMQFISQLLSTKGRTSFAYNPGIQSQRD